MLYRRPLTLVVVAILGPVATTFAAWLYDRHLILEYNRLLGFEGTQVTHVGFYGIGEFMRLFIAFVVGSLLGLTFFGIAAVQVFKIRRAPFWEMITLMDEPENNENSHTSDADR